MSLSSPFLALNGKPSLTS